MSGEFGLLADVAGGEAGEAGALGQQVVEVRGRDELGVRLAVHVDELREQELDVVGADVLARLVGRLGRRERSAPVHRDVVERGHPGLLVSASGPPADRRARAAQGLPGQIYRLREPAGNGREAHVFAPAGCGAPTHFLARALVGAVDT